MNLTFIFLFVAYLLLVMLLVFVVIYIIKFNKNTNNSEKIDTLIVQQEKQKEEVHYLKLKHEDLDKILNQNKENIINELIRTINQNKKDIIEGSDKNFEQQNKNIKDKFDVFYSVIDKNINNQNESINKITNLSLSTIKEKLDKIEGTVTEKLEKNIENSINKTFKDVYAKLEHLDKELKHIDELSNNISKVEKILGNIKTRGTLGEILLKDLLTDILDVTMFYEQYEITKNNRVDFAIKIPNENNSDLVFPLDAKFPMEQYLNLQNAKDNAPNIKDNTIEIAKKEFKKAIEEQAKSIEIKYIKVPKTTPFAAMYIPSEIIYSEIISMPELTEKIRKERNIMILGPSTAAAWLSVLKLAFQTVKLQKSSKDIIDIFKSFQKEFKNLTNTIDDAKKASKKTTEFLDKIVQTNSKMQEKISKINKIEGIEESKNINLLPEN